MDLVSVGLGKRVSKSMTFTHGMGSEERRGGKGKEQTCGSRHNKGVGAIGHLDLRIAEVDDSIVILENVDLVDAWRVVRR
jgi:hypothetical protein